MQRIRQILQSAIAIYLAAIPATGQRIDLPADLPSPFKIKLGSAPKNADDLLNVENTEAFHIYSIEPENPIEEGIAYRIWVSRRYGLITLIECRLSKTNEIQYPYQSIKEKLSKAYQEPRQPNEQEFEIYDENLGLYGIGSYNLIHYWEMKGWHIVMVSDSPTNGRLFFTVDRLLQRSVQYAPKP